MLFVNVLAVKKIEGFTRKILLGSLQNPADASEVKNLPGEMGRIECLKPVFFDLGVPCALDVKIKTAIDIRDMVQEVSKFVKGG